jgi:hypothetical protein
MASTTEDVVLHLRMHFLYSTLRECTASTPKILHGYCFMLSRRSSARMNGIIITSEKARVKSHIDNTRDDDSTSPGRPC